MKLFLKSNTWIIALAICLTAFLGYRAIETGNCVEADFKSFRAGSCRDN
ncbi:MAG: hypothetical protein AAF652_18030 [Cyanobacteria bacterium P01_C01_bin.72]